MSINWQELASEFPESEIEFRPGVVRADDKATEGFSALALAYITARAVMDRLDHVVGQANWRDEYESAPAGGVMCTLYIRVDDEWIGKSDVGTNTEFESEKGGVSDAFKRAAVKWGIGRYLYNLPNLWWNVREKEYKGKKTYTFINTPTFKKSSKLDDKRPASVMDKTEEKPAQPKGTQVKVDRPFVDVNEIVHWLQIQVSEMKASDNIVDAGKAANIARSMGEYLQEKPRHYLLWASYGIESSTQLTEKQWLALKAWLNTTPAILKSESILITREFEEMESEGNN